MHSLTIIRHLCLTLIVSLLPCDNLMARHWEKIIFPENTSMPSLSSSRIAKWCSDCSLVRVKEVKRKVHSSTQSRSDFSQIPSRVTLEYRIEEVFAGDKTLISKTACAEAWEQGVSGKSLTNFPVYSEWVPAPNDEGIWLVKRVDGKIICVSIQMLGIRFPVYASEAHQRVLGPQVKYSKVLEFAKKLKQAAGTQQPEKQAWLELVRSDNRYISQWAVWELSERFGTFAIKELRSLCSETHKHLMVQAIADDALLAIDDEWRLSPGRKAMVAKWLALEYSKLTVFTSYMGLNRPDGSLRGYDPVILKQQAAQAQANWKPTSKEWQFLKYVMGTIDKRLSLEQGQEDGQEE